MSAGVVFLIIICAMFPTLIIVAVVVKLYEVRQASRWPATEGKVLVSSVQSHQNKPDDAAYGFSDTEVTNQPLVEYEFQVGSKKYRGNRITIGEKISGFELEQTLARYPVGTTVTVYYDPADPNKAVLERDLPWGIMAAGLGCLMLFFIGGPLLAALFYFKGVDWVQPQIANPKVAPVVVVAVGFGLAVLWFAVTLSRMRWEASRWPTVRGEIVDASVESFLDWRDTDYAGRSRKSYRSSVVYRYEVNGQRYLGDRIVLAVRTSASFTALARGTARQYPVGAEVDVHYNPKNPGESVLYPYTRWHWLLWAIAAGLFGLAWAIATGRLG